MDLRVLYYSIKEHKLEMKDNTTILIVCALGIAIGYYYCADILQAEQTQLKHHPYFLTSQQFNYLYFFTYFAQFLLLIPVGILVDIMPLKIVMTAVIVVTICAQTVLGILLDVRGQNYIIFMYIARGVLGICGLSIITIQGKLADKFSKKNYELIMGLCLNVPYIFNALNSFITAAVQSQTDNMPLCFYIGSGFCMISLLFAFWIIIKFLNPAEEETVRSPTIQHHHQQNPGFSLETLKDFKIEFWVIILSIFFTEGSINPVIDNLSDFITKSFGIQSSQVGMIVPILFISLTPFSLILSKFIQHFPSQKRNMMIASRLLYVIALIVLINIPQTDTPTFFNYAIIIIFLVVMSFNWAVFHSILEPGLACFVKEQELGTALGIMGSCMGLSQSLFSLMNITVTTSSKSLLKSYSTLIFYYVIIASVSVLLAIWVRVRDYDVLDKQFSEEDLQASDYAKVGIAE